MKLNKTTKVGFAGVAGCLGVLGLLTVAMLCPIRSDGANAVECTADSTDPSCASSSAKMDVRANVASVISLSLAESSDIDVTPTSSGTFGSATSALKVSTNNPSGYKIYMRTGDGNAALKGSSGNTQTINAVAEGATKASFGKNTWGYNLSSNSTTIGDGTTYSPVPTSTTTPIQTITTTSLNDEYKLTFATNVASDLKTDTYSNSVVVSVVANPTEITRLTQLTYMQDMDTSICNNSSEGDTKQLVDTRDGNRYYVAKMKDGNCWMTQNLALDIDATKGLSASDTDIASDWVANPGTGWTAANITAGIRPSKAPYVTYTKGSETYYPPSTTETAVPEAVSSPSQVTTYSWNLGKYVLATPLKTTSCGDTQNLANCLNVGFVDVSGSEWKPTFQAQVAAYNGPGDYAGETTYIAVDYVNKTYDPHYLIGNYYQWNTATAGTGGTITSADATGSICPKGWKLPTSGDSAASPKEDSFYSLLSKYGVDSKLSSTGENALPNLTASTPVYNIAAEPLYFVRSGYVNIFGGGRYYSGIVGYVWSSFGHSNGVDGYYLYFSASAVGPSGSNSRWIGFPLRCLGS